MDPSLDDEETPKPNVEARGREGGRERRPVLLHSLEMQESSHGLTSTRRLHRWLVVLAPLICRGCCLSPRRCMGAVVTSLLFGVSHPSVCNHFAGSSVAWCFRMRCPAIRCTFRIHSGFQSNLYWPLLFYDPHPLPPPTHPQTVAAARRRFRWRRRCCG